MSSTAAERLQLLQEHIRLSLLEQKRTLASGVEPDTRNTYEISRSLDTFHQGLEQLEREQRELENSGELSSVALREREDILIQLRSQYDDLHAQFSSQHQHPTPTPPIPTATIPMTTPGHHRRSNSFSDSAARTALMGSRNTPSTLRKSMKTVRFRDSLVDAEELDNQQVLQLHNQVMEEQDESLDRLSESIRTQREISIQIGDELDSHVLLLDDVDALVERHGTRLGAAKRRLEKVGTAAKEHGRRDDLEPPTQRERGWLTGGIREFDGYCGADYYSGAAYCYLEIV
ncbi:hypothetical protein EX30DRAFT_343749 [Ascodesmis nigricans]|uniref:t-SNARE coiled-coil homology domain-containing protein n=1 Tax=Ascodesmis nigricans TaxID=341454 RepID=A0A4S2MRM1_9PEZI|nr:hypothetical protein EX30DRAFT_343749 [Ascodesmis nigricans]